MPSRFAVRKRLAALLRRLADWLDRPVLTPMEIPFPSGVDATSAGLHRFEVRRRVRGQLHTLYDGPRGAVARDKFLHEKTTKQPGDGWLVMDGVVRDHFSNPE